MAYFRYQTAVAYVRDFESLLEIWPRLRPDTPDIIGSVIVEKPLTAAQIRKLPKELRALLDAEADEVLDDSLGFLERLYDLDDGRTARPN